MPHRAKRPLAPRAAVLVVGCLAAGVLFCLSLDRLWPLARLQLVGAENELVSAARVFLAERGQRLDGSRTAEWLGVDKPALDYVETAFGLDRTQAWIEDGLPLFDHNVAFKRAGDPTTLRVLLHPARGIVGWDIHVEEDDSGARLGSDAARQLAVAALVEELGLDRGALEQRSATTEQRPSRVDHRFVFERELSESPELRERFRVTVAGERVVSVLPTVVVPAPAARAARQAAAPGVALETVGVALLAVAAVGAFVVFLRRLGQGEVRLGRALVWPAVVFVCFGLASLLDYARLFRSWDPLWPLSVSVLRYLVSSGIERIWVVILLLAVVAAGDALDRSSGARRGAALWSLARGRLLDPAVAAASGRGFLIGLLCGGVMAAAVLVLQAIAGAKTSIQPRGFFFYPLNSASPAATSLLFFWAVALTEELGYRFFGGTWLLRLTRRAWPAVILPALIYGLTHTRLDFLPPAEPFWGRAIVLTLVGCVWGWAFLRFDALTVVLSHFTADLFIFNWPRLASGQIIPVVVAVLTIGVPLLPALLWPFSRRRGGG